MRRIFHGLILVIFLFQIPCYLVFAETIDGIKINEIEVNVEDSTSYGYKLNCIDENDAMDTGEIEVYSPHGSEWEIDWSTYRNVQDEMAHYNLEEVTYGETDQGKHTVTIKNMTVYPCLVLMNYPSGMWKDFISGEAFENKPDIFEVTTIKGREALIVGCYDYDNEPFDYFNNTSGLEKVNTELSVSINFQVFFYMDEFDYMGDLIMMTEGSGYSSYSLPDIDTPDQVESLDSIPVEEIIAGLKANVDSYFEKAIQIPKNTKISVYKVPFLKDYEYTEGEDQEEELIIMEIPDSNNGMKIVIGIAVAGVGIIIIGALAIGKLPIKSPIKGPTGISDGTEKVLKGKTDGREYNIKYNAEKDEWTNTETGNIFIPERFEGWQEDLAKDWEQSAKERERMSNRDTEFDREVKESIEKDKENAELLKKLHLLRRSLNLQRTDAGRINRPSGEPGSMTDKINELENQIINGEAVDKELLRKVQRVYTKASNGDIAGFDDLPNNSLGKEIGDAIELTGKEIFSGSSKKALVLRGLMAIASGGATEMGMEIASAGFVIKEYVDKGGNSIVEGIILGTGNAIISEGAGIVTGKSIKFISKKGSKVISKIAKSSKFNYKDIEVEVGLNDKVIKRIVTEGGETFKNIYVAPPFQNIYKSFFIK